MTEKTPLQDCVSCGAPLLSQLNQKALFNQQRHSMSETLAGINRKGRNYVKNQNDTETTMTMFYNSIVQFSAGYRNKFGIFF